MLSPDLGKSAPMFPPEAGACARVPNGFTLVELVITLLVVGIMADIMIPLIRPERFQLDSATIRVASSFIAQQRNAVLRQHNLVVGVDTLRRQLRVHYDADNDAAIGAGEQWFVVELGEGVVFGRGGAPARALSGRTVSMQQEQGGLPALTYRRNGSASEQAIVYLTSERAALYGDLPTDGRAVEIERATGRVSCYSYRSGAWVQSC
jgi:prepilin-type N-terminal cleavage/methylation domain-containing protein